MSSRPRGRGRGGRNPSRFVVNDSLSPCREAQTLDTRSTADTSMAASGGDSSPPVDWSVLRRQFEDSSAQDSNGDSLRRLTPDEDSAYNGLYLDEEMSPGERKKWIQDRLEWLWSSDKCPNPFRSALAMALKCHDFKDSKPSTMAGKIIICFDTWISRDHRAEALRDLLTPDFQKSVFDHFIVWKNSGLRGRVFRFCRLHENGNQFLGDVQELLKKQDLKRACEVAASLELHGHFDLDRFVVPLCLEGNLEPVHEYIADSEQRQIELVRRLDQALANGKKDPIKKAIDKLLSVYKLGEHHAPRNAAGKKRAGFYSLVKRRSENRMTLENWRDLVGKNADGDVELQVMLVRILSEEENDVAEAAFWTRRFKLPSSKVPSRVWKEASKPEVASERLDDSLSQSLEAASLSSGVQEECFQLPSGMNIHIVETRDAFRSMVDQLKKEVVVGIDAENRPLSFTSSDAVAILQIALSDQVFVLDVVALRDRLEKEDWEMSVRDFFSDHSIKKLGYGTKNDILTLQKTVPFLHDLEERSYGFLDMECLERAVIENDIVQAPHPSDRKGLSGLVQSFFGLPLDKRHQMSDWDRRPLTEEQLRYAALDAWVLVEIFNQMEDIVGNNGKGKQFGKIVHDLVRYKNKIPKGRRNRN